MTRRVAPRCQHGPSRSHISRQLKRIVTKGEGIGRRGEEVFEEKGQEDSGRVKRKRCSYERCSGEWRVCAPGSSALAVKCASPLYESVMIRDQRYVFLQYCFNYICKWQNNFANSVRQYG